MRRYFGIVLSIGLLLTSCNSLNQLPEPPLPTQPPPAIGSTIPTGALQWTITTVEVIGSTLSGQGRETHTIGQYIAVNITVTNTSTQTVKLYPPNIVASDHVTYHPSDAIVVTLINPAPCRFKDLPSQSSTPCRFIFETPKNIQPQLLRLHSEYDITPDIDLTRTVVP